MSFSSTRRWASIRSIPSETVSSTSFSGSMPGSSAFVARVSPSRYSSTRICSSPGTSAPMPNCWRIGMARNHSSNMRSSRPNGIGIAPLLRRCTLLI
jgi:hypothetical protein